MLMKAKSDENGVPKGIRTPVVAVKGRCPRPLDDGDNLNRCIVENTAMQQCLWAANITLKQALMSSVAKIFVPELRNIYLIGNSLNLSCIFSKLLPTALF